MVEERRPTGSVYIFQNVKAGRVKVGTTINDARLRLRDVDLLWSGRKPTCQICGSRRLAIENGLFPKHVVSGGQCPGSNELPLERDVSIAELHLEKLSQGLPELSGVARGSAVREIGTLRKRIELFRNYRRPEGIWDFRQAYYTECAYRVESLTHELLSDVVDMRAPLGEVFMCSVSDAKAAVEEALRQLGLSDSVWRKARDDRVSYEYGECLICGGPVTKRESCPTCARRFRLH